jgi:endoglucanase
MRPQSKKFLFDLLNAPSPTGYEQPAQRIVRAYAKGFSKNIETDLHGNVMVAVNPNAKRRVMLAGHCDQIGFMVTHISKDGFIYVAALGGIDTGVLPGAHVTIYHEGKAVAGVMGRKPIHLQTDDERGRAKIEMDKVWIDIGAKTKREAEKMVAVGDPVTFKLGVTELPNELVTAAGLDNKVGLFVACEAARICAESKVDVAVYAVSTVQEEVGLRGAQTSAFGIDPEVGIAIDVTHANDNPGNENQKVASCKVGSGPTVTCGPNTNPVVEKMLVAAAKKAKVPYQIAPSARLLGNDANAIQVARAGIATASIGIPNRYMHSQVEICSLTDLENAAKLLAKFCQSITKGSDFRPM